MKSQQVPIRPQPTRATATRPEVRVVAHALFQEVVSYVWLSLRRLGVPEADREDLAQEIMTEAYTKRQEYTPARASPRRWIHGFIVNYVRNYRRKKSKTRGLLVEPPPDLADKSPNAEDQYVAEAQRYLLHEVLFPQVEFDYLTVLIAHDLDDLDFTSIAKQQNISVSAANERYHRGIVQLQAAYARHQRDQKRRGLIVLPLGLDQLLAADRTVPDAPPELVDRLWDRMERTRKGGAHWQTFRAALGHPAVRFAGIFLVGGVVGALVYAALHPGPSPSPVIINRPTPAESTQGGELGAAVPSATTPTVALLSAAPSSGSARRSDTEEQHLVDAAHQAVARGNFDVALKTLAAHERKFPSGYFAEARELLRAQITQLRTSGNSAPEPQVGPVPRAPLVNCAELSVKPTK